MVLVSVILPCYNSETTIASAIQSILNQTFSDFELIIVDDASTDNSIAVVKSFDDSRIKLIQQKENGGYPVAMNAGISIATGKYIARMDGDDISAPTRLEKQLKILKENSSASFCGTDRFRILPSGKMFIDKKMGNRDLKWESYNDLLDGKRTFTDASVMIIKEKVLNVGGYRTFQRSGMDVDIWLRVMEKFGDNVTITEPLYGRTLDPHSLVFKPQTFLINQVPRVLAMQRIEFGTDDVQAGKGVRIDEYVKKGLIKTANNAGIELLMGTAATCIWLGDWRGARLYYRKIKSIQKLSIVKQVKIVFMIARKLIQRIRNSPYQELKF